MVLPKKVLQLKLNLSNQIRKKNITENDNFNDSTQPSFSDSSFPASQLHGRIEDVTTELEDSSPQIAQKVWGAETSPE